MMAQSGARQDRLFDQRGHDFFQIDNAFIDVYGPRVGAYGIAVYAILVRHAGGAGDAWPGRKRIAKLAGCSPSTVDRAVLQLAAEGLLTKEARVSENHGQESNLYTLNRVSADGSPETTPLVPETTPPYSVGIAPLVPETTKEDTSNKTHSEQEKNPPRTARGGDAPSASEADAWGELKTAIARVGTNRPQPRIATKGGKPYGWIGEIVGAVGSQAGNDPVLAAMIWGCFEDSLSADDRAKYINQGNLCSRFLGWSANGGQSTIQGARQFYATIKAGGAS